METGRLGATRAVLDLTTQDNKSVNTFKNAFAYPLPSSGNSISPLTSLPKHMDIYSTKYSRDQNYTAWNTQSHALLLSFGAKKLLGASRTTAIPKAKTTNQVKLAAADRIDVFIREFTKRGNYYTHPEINDLRNGAAYLTEAGEIVYARPDNAVFIRTVPHSTSDPTPPSSPFEEIEIDEMVFHSPPKTGTDRLLRSTTGVPEALDKPGPVPVRLPNVEGSEGPPHGSALRIPVRSVEPSLSLFQSPQGQKIPKSPFYIGLESANIGDSSAKVQQLVPTVRSQLARDMPAISACIAYMESSNAPHIDTAAVTRALCYAYPAHEDAWFLDKIDNHFVREQIPNSRTPRIVTIYTWPQDWGTLNIPVIAVTLPAFASMLKKNDAILNSNDPAIHHGFCLDNMDQVWACVPIDSVSNNQRWTMEYIMAHLTTEYWAGRTNWTWKSQHGPGVNAHETYFTTTPAAHNVYIPGPSAVMLVMLEESGWSANPVVHMEGIADIPIYQGSQKYVQLPNLDNYVSNLGPLWERKFSTQNYSTSAGDMASALDYIQNNTATDMAYPLGVSLAAELCSTLPHGVGASPVVDQKKYSPNASGAWTFGERKLDPNGTTPLTSSNIVGGAADTWPSRWDKLIAGYNASMLSPCLQLASSYADTGAEEMLLDPNNRANVFGILRRWKDRKPNFVNSQYTCHTSHGVYRVLTCLGYILKTDYRFNLLSTAGIQNTLSMHGVILTCSLSDMLVRNDLPLRLWTGIERANTPGLTQGIRELVGQVTYRYIRGRELSEYFEHVAVDPSDAKKGNWSQAMTQRVGVQIGTLNFMNSIPIPIALWLQWTRKVYADPELQLNVDYGIIAPEWEALHYMTQHTDSVSRVLISATTSTHKKLPVTMAIHGAAGNIPVTANVDNWQMLTSQHLDPDVSASSFSSSVLCMSSKYHYLNTKSDGTFLTINDMLTGKTTSSDVIDTSPLVYPDPPTKAFLDGEDLVTTSESGGTVMPSSKPEDKQNSPPIKTPEAPTPVENPIAKKEAPAVVDTKVAAPTTTPPAKTVAEAPSEKDVPTELPKK